MFFYNLLLAFAFCQEVFTVDVKQLFYEKNLSEYCKRRVIPSIFLGRHVVEASSFILHFTKLNLPYNCFISIRAESGSNMIMVITLPNDASLEQSCSAKSPQLLVYEMGETFGGYWGMLPGDMLRQEPPIHKFYTLKTTEPTTAPTEPITEEYIESTEHTPASEVDRKETEEYIRVEVPIVNVSGRLVQGSEQPTKAFDFEEAFDYQYDVTPIPGVKYDTSILPLVQLSVRKQTEDGRRGNDVQEPRYELDVVEEFTPDSRITLPQFTPNEKRTRRTNANRRMSFGKNRGTKGQLRKNYRMPATKINKHTKYIFPTTISNFNMKHKLNYTRDSWEVIDKLMDSLKKKEHEYEEQDNESKQNNDYRKNTSKIAENISNMKHNFSIYLQPNLSVYNEDKSSNLLQFTTKQTISPLRSRTTINPSNNLAHIRKRTTLVTKKEKKARISTTPIFLQTQKIKDIINKTTTPVTSSFANSSTSAKETYSTENHVFKMDSQKNETIKEFLTTRKVSTVEISKAVPPLSLVDHESWENIVQAAPGMAVLLNQSVTYNVNTSDWSSLNETYRKELLVKKKRSIQSIAIDNGRPHNLTTKAKTLTTTKGAYNIGDMQEFSRLVELQDDDMHGRVALRYLKHYVGPAIYNICGDAQPLNRHVYLFNSSRIVLSLNNFTLSRISVILTGARTLLSSEMRCPTSQLECQVSGARVCVDSLAACDGVPNCGSYDIYDEDRLMCGVALGLQHNVYLAAFTFLALLLTLFYGVHYWLKRCVPKVADAFFVYMDGVENYLYLDSVMRPPGDYDYGTRMFYRGSMYTRDMLSTDLKHESKGNLCSRLFRKCFFCFRKNQEEKQEDLNEHEVLGHRKTFSFTKMELSNIGNNNMVRPTVDTSVQTGDSLEMTICGEQRELQVTRNKKCSAYTRSKDDTDQSIKTKGLPIMIRDSLLTLEEPLPEDELSLMKFFRDSRSNSSDSLMMKEINLSTKLDFSTGTVPDGEQEISNVMYDGRIMMRPGASGVKPKSKVKPKVQSRSRRRIRFEEATTTIPSHDSDDDDIQPRQQRPVLTFGQTRPWRSLNLSTIKEDDESGNKHRHFWESKGKKSSKKSNVLLRNQ